MNPLDQDFLASLKQAQAEYTEVRWPHPVYAQDPVGFFYNVLGVNPWSRQRDVLTGYAEHDRFACCAGRKVSKSNSIAGLALWRWCSFADANVVLTSTVDRQVDEILWSELRKLVARSGVCFGCRQKGLTSCEHSIRITDTPALKAATGLKSADFRTITGYTAKDVLAIQGTSGFSLHYFIDEAPGARREMVDAFEGNLAGGGSMAMFGNPNKSDGPFYEAFHKRDTEFFTVQISSEESPNVISGKLEVPGLATRDWIQKRRIAWGWDPAGKNHGALYMIHVLGRFVKNETAKICGAGAISEAQDRWHSTLAEGGLVFGFDPAGESVEGDESVMAGRRGQKILGIKAYRGASEDALIGYLLHFVSELRQGKEKVTVVIDASGSIGGPIYKQLRKLAEDSYPWLRIVPVFPSGKARREIQYDSNGAAVAAYDRVRDELWACFAKWLRTGAIPPGELILAAELNAPSWSADISGRLKATPKEELRRADRLGHSPDRADAVCLSTWIAGEEYDPEPEAVPETGDSPWVPSLDPYSALDTWQT